MPKFLIAFQILVALLLIGAILLQGRGSGLTSPFGGVGKTFHTRRGLEKVLYYATVFLAVIFTLTLIAVVLF